MWVPFKQVLSFILGIAKMLKWYAYVSLLVWTLTDSHVYCDSKFLHRSVAKNWFWLWLESTILCSYFRVWNQPDIYCKCSAEMVYWAQSCCSLMDFKHQYMLVWHWIQFFIPKYVYVWKSNIFLFEYKNWLYIFLFIYS